MNRPPPSPPPNDGAAPTNGLSRLIRQVSQIGAGGNAGAPSPKARSPVANTLRNLFTPEHFRQMLEFHFIPGAPVRVREEWKAQGDTPIQGHGRFRFEAAAKFAGWQEHGQTNCARIDAHGKLFSPGSLSPTNAPPKPDTLKATLWIDPQLGFPMTTLLDTQMPPPDNLAARKGTNNVVAKNVPKSVRQSITITLLEAGPVEGLHTDADTPAQ